jgi:hypothetical protein
MARPSAEIRAELDAINRRRRAIDRIIEDNRARLKELNTQVPDLEREYQSAVALEQQAAIDSQAQPKH